MTLGGMAIALGALVDDAIIVVENIVRRLRLNLHKPAGARHSTLAVVFEATREIQGSIVFATLVIMLVFLPLFFLAGVEGRLMVPLGFAYVVSLAASLLVAITVTPVLASLWLPAAKAVTREEEPWLGRWLKARYRSVLGASLRRWRLVALLSLLLLGAAIGSLAIVGRAFLPDFNEGSLTVSAVTLPGTSLEQSDQLAQGVESILLAQPEVLSTARRTGRAELDPHAQGIHASEIDVSLAMKDRGKDQLLAALRAEFGQLPGMNVVIGQPISHRIDHMLSGTRANIAVKIFGPDLYELRRIARQIKGVAEAVPGAVDVSAEQQTDIPLLAVKFNREAIARHGLSIEEVGETIEAAFSGRAVSKVLDGQASYDLVVRYSPEAIANFDAIGQTMITTASGARLPLTALAEIQRERGPNMISRENVQRKIVVMANVAGRDLGGVVEDIRRGVAEQVKLPTGYHVEYGGQFESAEEAARTLLVLGVGVVVGIFLLLFAAFHSARDAALVMLNLPLALIGGVAGVFASGGIMSVASIIGFITLFGIATRNGVMMVAHIRHLVADEGVADAFEAVRRGAEERLVPILMTALAAGLALVPLALSAGPAGQRDSGADGGGDSVRPAQFHGAQHDRRTGAVSAIRLARPIGGGRCRRDVRIRSMTALRHPGVLAALGAALLFGAGTPFAKLLLGPVSPWLLAGVLYLGSGIGLALLRMLRGDGGIALPRQDLPWLAGATLSGGVVAPVLLMWGLAAMPASGAALLLNAESVFTAVIAWVVFRENVDRRIFLGMLLIVAGAIVLAWRGAAELGSPLPAIAVLGACLAWGIDNNLTRKVSLSDANLVAMIKGLCAGSVNLVLAISLGATVPASIVILAAGVLGFLSYGLSLSLFVIALRHLGTARTGAYFSTAPFAGAIIGIALLGEPVTLQLALAGLLMAVGVWLHLTERHRHRHSSRRHRSRPRT